MSGIYSELQDGRIWSFSIVSVGKPGSCFNSRSNLKPEKSYFSDWPPGSHTAPGELHCTKGFEILPEGLNLLPAGKLQVVSSE